MEIESRSTSRLVYISSDDRKDPTDTTTKFTVDLGVGSELHRVRRIVLKSCHFINRQYNVRNQHNTLRWTHGAIDYEVVVSSGFYNTTQLSSELKTLMDAAMLGAGVTVTITQDTITGKLTFTWSNLSGYIWTIENGSNLSPELGFITERPDALEYTADRQPELNGLTHCYLRSNILSAGNMIKSDEELNNTFGDIPVDVNYGQAVNYRPYDDELESKNFQTRTDIREIDIFLEDDDGSPVDLNGGELETVWKVYF